MIANASPPPEYVGNRLYLYNARWRDLEPSRDDYSGIDDLVRDLQAIDADPDFDGVMLQVRGIVVNYTSDNEPTSPTWLTSPVVVEAEALQLTGLLICVLTLFVQRLPSASVTVTVAPYVPAVE